MSCRIDATLKMNEAEFRWWNLLWIWNGTPSAFGQRNSLSLIKKHLIQYEMNFSTKERNPNSKFHQFNSYRRRLFLPFFSDLALLLNNSNSLKVRNIFEQHRKIWFCIHIFYIVYRMREPKAREGEESAELRSNKR